MRLKGYIDESYGQKIFTLSCLMSDAKGWISFQFAWKNLLRSKQIPQEAWSPAID
jgi:hypothetical protein